MTEEIPEPAPQTAAPEEKDFKWALVEVFGHRSHAGKIWEVQQFGASMMRIDVPKMGYVETVRDGQTVFENAILGWVTHFYGGGSLFSLTYTDEETVRRHNSRYLPHPARALPAPERDEESYHDDES